MNFRLKSVAVGAIAVLGCSGVANASGFYQLRGSLSPGLYESKVSGSNISSKGDGTIYAFDLGSVIGFKLSDTMNLAVDLELEAMSVDAEADGTISGQAFSNPSADFERTDLKLTTGLAINLSSQLSLSPFLGYRTAWQGDGYFDDTFYTENGFFLGLGASASVGKQARIAGAFAFNKTKLDSTGGTEDDADGYSVRLTLRPNQHYGVSLKYQGFETDGSVELKEDYYLASVTWYFLQGAI